MQKHAADQNVVMFKRRSRKARRASSRTVLKVWLRRGSVTVVSTCEVRHGHL